MAMSFFAGWNWQGFLPWFWLALVVIFSIVEALTMTLMTVWFAAAALVMVFVSLLPIPIVVQLVLFALISALLLLFSRPIALKFLKLKKTATNSDSLVGRTCRLLRPVTLDEKGTARLNGVEWSVASVDGAPLEVGKDCIVQEIKGNTLFVSEEVK